MGGSVVLGEVSHRTITRINIWRAEVKSTETYCSCSAPAIREPDSKDALLTSTANTAVASEIPPEPPQQPVVQPVVQPAPAPSGPATFLAGPSDGPPICPICLLPIDEGVSFARLREHGDEGLVRSRSSPRSEASIKGIGDVTSSKDYTTPRKIRIRRAVKRPLRPFKRAKMVVASKGKKFKKKRIVRRVKRLFKGSKDSVSSDDHKIRPRATEMYRAYRYDAKPEADAANADAGSVETLDGLSDDSERRRPRLTIDESAARLRRAQKLLGKTKASKP
ncbi:hypothetical protein F4677DRAFT_14752 [Hypoxylon crocopeplum]|nr:hypothetical protein F4677DRAFT_14752 [Hypoxylon crocopeplum]